MNEVPKSAGIRRCGSHITAFRQWALDLHMSVSSVELFRPIIAHTMPRQCVGPREKWQDSHTIIHRHAFCRAGRSHLLLTLVQALPALEADSLSEDLSEREAVTSLQTGCFCRTGPTPRAGPIRGGVAAIERQAPPPYPTRGTSRTATPLPILSNSSVLSVCVRENFWTTLLS